MKLHGILKKARHQAGVTLLEFIAFLGLAALVVAGSLALYGSASAGASATALVTTAKGIVVSMRATFPRGLDASSYTPGNLNAAGAPAGWGSWAILPGYPGAVLKKGSHRFILAANSGGGTFNLSIDAGDSNLCKLVLNANPVVGGVLPGGNSCVGSDQLYYSGISLP